MEKNGEGRQKKGRAGERGKVLAGRDMMRPYVRTYDVRYFAVHDENKLSVSKLLATKVHKSQH